MLRLCLVFLAITYRSSMHADLYVGFRQTTVVEEAVNCTLHGLAELATRVHYQVEGQVVAEDKCCAHREHRDVPTRRDHMLSRSVHMLDAACRPTYRHRIR